MKPVDAIAHVRALHASYEARTGYPIRWNLHRENQWGAWLAYCEWEWTDKELALVISYLRTKINKGERNEGALKFDNLIGNPPGFEEDLNLAKEARQGIPTKPRPSSPQAKSQGTVEAPLSPEESAALWRQTFRPHAD